MITKPVMLISSSPDPNALPGKEDVHSNTWYNQDFEGYRISEQPLHQKAPIRIVCVGAGASGLQIAYKAERALENYELQIYDKNDDVGGTWLENVYPGCTCDIPSHSYQFPWAKNPNWSAYYSSSKEIWQYFKDISIEYQLEKYIKLNTTVKEAIWHEDKGRYQVKLVGKNGDEFEDWCDVLLNATGVLNSWKYPDIPGIDQFKGHMMHSAAWDTTYDLTDKTVAVIGGGSSAVQIVPAIQPRVKKLTAFLRSPVWVTTGFGAKHAGPGGTNFDYTAEQIQKWKANPEEYERYCRDVEGELNKRFTLMHTNGKDQAHSRELIANLMSERLNNKELEKHLIPNFALGCRRMTPGSRYLECLSEANVQPVHTGVARLTENSVVDENGNEHMVDVVICATGFNTSFTPHFKVTGRNNAVIKDQFGDFPKAYLSVTVPNFPNFFRKCSIATVALKLLHRPRLISQVVGWPFSLVTLLIRLIKIVFQGPNGPASHSSILPIMTWYTRYTFQAIEKMQRENIKAFEPKQQRVKDLYNHTHELMKRLVWSARKTPLKYTFYEPYD
jgi:cation diffusion facilitator CzcD-associated flavoprotein CzcO